MENTNNQLGPVGNELPTRETNFGRRRAACHEPLYSFLRPAVEKDEIGRLGNYRVMRLLGMGGMGMVFLAEDVALRRAVALKVMKPGSSEDAVLARQRFLREARAMAAIKHDHLVTVYQVGEDNDTVFLAMELLDGLNLEDRLASGSLELADGVRLGCEVALGLQAIHERGLIHRDIKPSNIFLESRPQHKDRNDEDPAASSIVLSATSFRTKILDFGLAREAQGDSQLTAAGMLVGTPAYLSPEQARGKPLDARSDLFSLGCVLYRTCTGVLPFHGDNALDQLAAVTADDATPVRALNPAVPESLAQLITQLLAKNPNARPATAAIVAERLRQIGRTLTHTGRTAGHAAPHTGKRAAPDTDVVSQPRATRAVSWPKLGLVVALVTLTALAGLGLVHMWQQAPANHDRPEKHEQAQDGKGGKAATGDRTFLSNMTKAAVVNWPFHKLKEEKGGKKFKDDKGHKGPPPELSGPIVVRGQVSPHGIMMHPAPPFDEPASITYDLGKQFQFFAAEASINDTAGESPSALTFMVFGDDQPLWTSRQVLTQDDAQSCRVSVKGVQMLKLQVTAEGDVRRAHAVWIEPHVTR